MYLHHYPPQQRTMTNDLAFLPLLLLHISPLFLFLSLRRIFLDVVVLRGAVHYFLRECNKSEIR